MEFATYTHEFFDLTFLHALLQRALLGCRKPVGFFEIMLEQDKIKRSSPSFAQWLLPFHITEKEMKLTYP